MKSCWIVTFTGSVVLSATSFICFASPSLSCINQKYEHNRVYKYNYQHNRTGKACACWTNEGKVNTGTWACKPAHPEDSKGAPYKCGCDAGY